jgi:hypothetical protein
MAKLFKSDGSSVSHHEIKEHRISSLRFAAVADLAYTDSVQRDKAIELWHLNDVVCVFSHDLGDFALQGHFTVRVVI